MEDRNKKSAVTKVEILLCSGYGAMSVDKFIAEWRKLSANDKRWFSNQAEVEWKDGLMDS